MGAAIHGCQSEIRRDLKPKKLQELDNGQVNRFQDSWCDPSSSLRHSSSGCAPFRQRSQLMPSGFRVSPEFHFGIRSAGACMSEMTNYAFAFTAVTPERSAVSTGAMSPAGGKSSP